VVNVSRGISAAPGSGDLAARLSEAAQGWAARLPVLP
jgi:hypothetical protein